MMMTGWLLSKLLFRFRFAFFFFRKILSCFFESNELKNKKKNLLK